MGQAFKQVAKLLKRNHAIDASRSGTTAVVVLVRDEEMVTAVLLDES